MNRLVRWVANSLDRSSEPGGLRMDGNGDSFWEVGVECSDLLDAAVAVALHPSASKIGNRALIALSRSQVEAIAGVAIRPSPGDTLHIEMVHRHIEIVSDSSASLRELQSVVQAQIPLTVPVSQCPMASSPCVCSYLYVKASTLKQRVREMIAQDPRIRSKMSDDLLESIEG